MKLKQISVPIENSLYRLHELTRALGEAGINLRALNLVDNGDFGELRILVSDVSAARRITMQRQIPARIEEVVAVRIDDRPGEFSRLLEPLLQAGIGIRYAYACAGMDAGQVVMVIRFNDNDRAVRILAAHGAAVLDKEALGRIDESAPAAAGAL